MRKRILGIMISLALCLWMLPLYIFTVSAEETEFAGSGTEKDPYQISSAYLLTLLAEKVNELSEEGSNSKYTNAYYIQTADIDLKNRSWTPVGAYASKNFNGKYDGNYHEIKNLNCDSETSFAGLFGRVGNEGKITNLSVYGNVTSEKGTRVGGIVGELGFGATMKNCSFTGDVSGERLVGGVAGVIYNGGYIYNCYHNGTVTATNEQAGGVVGGVTVGVEKNSANAGIYNSYHTGGTVKSVNKGVGGITGRIEDMKQTEGCTITLENNYYLSSTCDGGCNGENASGYKNLSDKLLKESADLLGAPFVNCSDSGINSGYPIFEWQQIPYQFKGSGTAEDPYQISSKKELETMRNLVNSNYFSSKYSNSFYIQTADIDLENELWMPIGKRMINGKDQSVPLFWGSYNGNYHTIKNLYVEETDGNRYNGLFGSVRGEGVIENLIVYGSVISNGNAVGGIAGEIVNGGSIVRNCAFVGDVSGIKSVGGIAGVVYNNGTIDSCYHIGDVYSSNTEAGGIVGRINVGNDYAGTATISNCYNVGNVSGTDIVGSIVGNMLKNNTNACKLHINNCYSIKDEVSITPNGEYDEYDVTSITKSMLKKVAESLSDSFVNTDDDSLNDGFPVFSWQLKKVSSKTGDLNNDNEVDLSDLTTLSQYLLQDITFDDNQIKLADVNHDGVVDICDLATFKQYVMKEIAEF